MSVCLQHFFTLMLPAQKNSGSRNIRTNSIRLSQSIIYVVVSDDLKCVYFNILAVTVVMAEIAWHALGVKIWNENIRFKVMRFFFFFFYQGAEFPGSRCL